MDIQKDQLKSEMSAEIDNILQYWMDNTLDDVYGGFVGKRDHFNTLEKGATKGAVLNARILWTFSIAYNFTKNKQFLDIAHRAFNYIVKHFLDQKNGGLYWELNEDGSVLNTRKQMYAQGFGIYGFSEYYKASGNNEALKYAIQLYGKIEEFNYDKTFGGYVEALSEKWEPLEDMRLSEKDANFPKTMNTHLHILEPYTNLYCIWPDPTLKQKIANLIHLFLDRIIDEKNNHLNLFFDMDWTVRSNITSYGHDIESAWLLAEAAYEIGDAELIEEVNARALKIVDATLLEGTAEDGSIYNEKEGTHLDTDKHWWPQAEALVGLSYAAKISGNRNYLNNMAKTWRFIKNNMLDKVNGEWFWRVDKNGIPYQTDDKAGFWKCPYHNTRALIEVINNL